VALELRTYSGLAFKVSVHHRLRTCQDRAFVGDDDDEVVELPAKVSLAVYVHCFHNTQPRARQLVVDCSFVVLRLVVLLSISEHHSASPAGLQ